MKASYLDAGKLKGASYFSHWDRHLLSFTHELSSPLTAAKINLDDYLLSGNSQGLELLSSNLKLMEDYLDSARLQIKRQPQKKIFSAKRQLELIVANLKTLAAKYNVEIYLKTTSDIALSGNPVAFKQIVGCVIKNGIEAYLETNETNRVVAIACSLEGDYVVVCISDNGMGVENEQNIFKPYYSSKNSQSSMGIGLSLATQSIAEDFGGYISLAQHEGYKTSFKLHFRAKK
jgi:C4-dicarboxylate-specific signal transduction histidine kinase